MQSVFLVCAVAGSTVFVVQFVLSLIGLGAEHMDASFDLVDHVDSGGLDHVHIGSAGDAHDAMHGHGSTRLFGMISFRTVVAAVAFFGLTGLALTETGLTTPIILVAACGAGFAAMYAVHYLMRQLTRLRHDGTMRIEWTVGELASVYIPIPGENSGQGKVQIKRPTGILECAAITAETEPLATGTVVQVVGVVGPSLLEVRTAGEAEDP